MPEQMTLFNNSDPAGPISPGAEGIRRRDKGIKQAATHAEDVHDGWQTIAMGFMERYAMTHHLFSGEMVRLESKNIVPTPPSLRAWGSILVGAAKRGWIKEAGFVRVTNPKAHRTPATLWESLLNKEI